MARWSHKSCNDEGRASWSSCWHNAPWSEGIGGIISSAPSSGERKFLRTEAVKAMAGSSPRSSTSAVSALEELLAGASSAAGVTPAKAYGLQLALTSQACPQGKELAKRVKKFAAQRSAEAHPEELRLLLEDLVPFFAARAGAGSIVGDKPSGAPSSPWRQSARFLHG